MSLTTKQQADALELELDPSYSHLEGWGEDIADTMRIIQELRKYPPNTEISFWSRDHEAKFCFGVKAPKQE